VRVFGAKINFFTLLRMKRSCCAIFPTLSMWMDLVVSDVHSEILEAFRPLHCGSINLDGGVLPLPSPEVHDQLLLFVDIEGEVIFLAPLRQGPHLLPVGSLIVVGIQAYHSCVVCKLED
jgi:hypothetical protein